VSIFESERSEDEPWLQEHKKHHQNPGTNFQDQNPSWNPPSPKRAKRLAPTRPLLSGVKKICPNCQGKVPMESLRNGKCLVCQVMDYLGPTP